MRRLYLISHGDSGRNGTCSRQNYSSYYGCCDAKISAFPQKCRYGKRLRVYFDRNGHKDLVAARMAVANPEFDNGPPISLQAFIHAYKPFAFQGEIARRQSLVHYS
ncbi:hypothetical protein STEG23_027723 [Scotinomys teguina]